MKPGWRRKLCRITQSIHFICLLAMMPLIALAACSGVMEQSSVAAPVVVSISPITASVPLGQQRQFTATVQGGDPTQGVNWSVQGIGDVGAITPGGLYSAPFVMPSSPTVTVRATSVFDPAKFAESVVTLLPPPDWGNLPVDIEVTNRNAWTAVNAPVTFGVPLRQGAHSNVDTLRIRQLPGGTNVPAQFQVLSRWPDNSIRWVLCDFLADAQAGTGQYQLDRNGTGNATGTDLSVVNGADEVEVNTGPLRFSLSKTGFRLFESIRIDRNQDGLVNNEVLDTAALTGIVVREGATEFLMDEIAPTRIEVEQAGPIRATIVAEGEHRNGDGDTILHYVCRITAWSGLPLVRIQYSFKNMQGHGAPTGDDMEAAAQLAAAATADAVHLDLPFQFGSTLEVAHGVSGGPHLTPPMAAGQHTQLLQSYAGAFDPDDPGNPQPPGFSGGIGSAETLTNNWPTDDQTAIDYEISGVSTANGDFASGWLQAVSDNLRVTLAVRDFWQMYPKSLRAETDGLMRVGIWPEEAWPLQVFAGAMRTHEVLFRVERAGSLSVSHADTLANQANDPLMGVCSPWHNAATRVFGQIGVTDATLSNVLAFVPEARSLASSYIGEVLSHFVGILADRNDGNGLATGHEYGFWNFGGGKTDDPAVGWENHRWEISAACLNWFAASGSPHLFRLGDETARHFRDVTVLHADIGMRYDYSEPGNPAVSDGKAVQTGRTRAGPSNKQHHLGRYDADDTGLGYLAGSFLGYHYLMTGDALSLDVFREVFLHLRGSWKRHFDANFGGVNMTMDAPSVWLSNALMIAVSYEMANGLNDSEASDMADFVLNVVRTRQTTPKAQYDPMGGGFGDAAGDFTAWQMGHMLEALEYARWILDDPSVDADILAAMEWLRSEAAEVYLGWLNPPVEGAFAEFPGGIQNHGGENLMIGAGFVGARREGSVTTWRARARQLLEAQLGEIDSSSLDDADIRHSTFARYFRAGPLLLGTLMP